MGVAALDSSFFVNGGTSSGDDDDDTFGALIWNFVGDDFRLILFAI